MTGLGAIGAIAGFCQFLPGPASSQVAVVAFCAGAASLAGLWLPPDCAPGCFGTARLLPPAPL